MTEHHPQVVLVPDSSRGRPRTGTAVLAPKGSWVTGDAPMRLPEVTRLAWGVALLIAPGRVSKTLTGVGLEGRARVVARVLGARHLTQALLVARTNEDAARRVGRVVDALHALSMIGLAAVDPKLRRPALADSALAGLFGLSGDSRQPDADPVGTPGPNDKVRLPQPVWFVPEDDGAALRRTRNAQSQQAIRDILYESNGKSLEQVKRDLQRALTDRGMGPQPESWMDAVASDVAMGHIYVVSEQAMADTGEVAREDLS